MALIAGSGLAALAMFVLVRRSLTDDAYIALDYARNLALHFHWGLISQETANTATSALNALLLGAVTAATRIAGGVHPRVALGVVSIGTVMALAWSWVRVARALRFPLTTAVLGVALVLVNPFLLSSVGLEVLLVSTLLSWLVVMALEERPLAFGVVAGLALLARLDLIVFIVAIGVATPTVRRAWRPALLAVVVVAAPWFLSSWLLLGSAVPDTLVLKLSQRGLFGPWSYFNGPDMYFRVWPAAVVLTFAPAAMGACAFAVWVGARWRQRARGAVAVGRLAPAAGLAAGGLAYYGLYALLGLPPYHWYYVPPTAALDTFLVVALGSWVVSGRVAGPRRVAGLLLAAVCAMAIGALAIDAGHGVPWRSPLISTNWADASAYSRVGAQVGNRVGAGAVSSPGEIGTLAYFCNCAIVDAFSDRGQTIPVINQQIATASPLKRLLLKLNYALLDRSQKPRPVAYHLWYLPGPGSGPDVWQVYSRWRGTGHFILISASGRNP